MTGAVPVPVRATVCGLLVALSTNRRVAVLVAVDVGANRTFVPAVGHPGHSHRAGTGLVDVVTTLLAQTPRRRHRGSSRKGGTGVKMCLGGLRSSAFASAAAFDKIISHHRMSFVEYHLARPLVEQQAGICRGSLSPSKVSVCLAILRLWDSRRSRHGQARFPHVA